MNHRLASCPLDHADSHRPAAAAGVADHLDRHDVLRLPMHRRMVVQYAIGDAGLRELRLFHEAKEVSFDDPDFFAFGETLARQSTFVAESAMEWGQGHSWAVVSDLLERLIEQGVLRHASEAPDSERIAGVDGACPSPLPPAPAAVARDWDDCEALFVELVGTPLELGHLELVIPIFRIAHSAIDLDGRQVGEANVFPPAMRIDVPTTWRICIYDGTRHQVDRPMNVTALKGMRLHWGQMMAALTQVRSTYLARFPDAAGGWTVGHLERLSTAVLAVPTFRLMRIGRADDRRLHPALASLFRVTDGLRMTMHQMLFVPIGEPTLSSDTRLDSAAIFAYAERNYAFHSEHGVCAGPKGMIEEFLSVLVDGRLPKDGLPPLEPEVAEALAAVEPAFDYAMLGLQAYACVFSLWPLMAEAYEELARVSGTAAIDDESAAVVALRDRLHGHLVGVRTGSYLANESWRADRKAVYSDMFAQCGLGLDGRLPDTTLAARLAVPDASCHGPARETLRRAVVLHLDRGSKPDAALVDGLVDPIFRFLLQEQRVLDAACEVQHRINRLLGRAAPRRAFTAVEIDLHNRLQGERQRRLPYLIDEVESLFGVRIVLDRERLEIIATPRIDAIELEPVFKNLDGIRPSDLRATCTRPS